jgi:hypothetical protein
LGHNETCIIKTYLHAMFIATLFKRAKISNQHRYPSTNEWIRKLWYRCTMGYYSAIKKNEILSFKKKGWN